MQTKKPLAAMLPEIKQHISNHVQFLQYNTRLFNVHEGQLRPEIEESLRSELKPESFERIKKRIPSINLLNRIVDKLSRVYSEPVERSADSPTDKSMIEEYEHIAEISERMSSANTMYNLHKCVALEPFVQEGQPFLRVLPANRFLVYSDDKVNPLRPTVFIKFLGKDRSKPFTDRDGRRTETDQDIREVQIYQLWSDTEYLLSDEEGQARTDLMQAQNLSGINPYETIPFVYINKSDFLLVPLPDTDTLENTILIPKLLADLNYAVQFQSHSILVATDLSLPPGLLASPDAVWELSSTDETRQGRMDAIKPTVDIEQVITLIKTTLSIWLEARNIRAGDMGQVSPGDAASGVARIIDESDATQDRQGQCGRFQDAERALWSLIAKMHNYWVSTGQVEKVPGTFSEDLTVSVAFGEQKPVVTDAERIANVQAQMDLGLITKRQALAILRPQLTEKQTEDWLKELEDAAKEGSAALNGAQVTSMVELMTQAGQGMIPKASVKAIIKVAFGIAEEAAEAIVSGLSNEPKQPAQVPPGQDNGPGGPPGNGGGASPDDSGASAGPGQGSKVSGS